ncbi:MAG: hypothetical protein ACRENG_09910 [bacterium]
MPLSIKKIYNLVFIFKSSQLDGAALAIVEGEVDGRIGRLHRANIFPS